MTTPLTKDDKFEHYCIHCAFSLNIATNEFAPTILCPECREPMTKVFEQELEWDSSGD